MSIGSSLAGNPKFLPEVSEWSQKLPEAKPISSELKKQFLTHIQPLQTQLNCLSFEEKTNLTLVLN